MARMLLGEHNMSASSEFAVTFMIIVKICNKSLKLIIYVDYGLLTPNSHQCLEFVFQGTYCATNLSNDKDRTTIVAEHFLLFILGRILLKS